MNTRKKSVILIIFLIISGFLYYNYSNNKIFRINKNKISTIYYSRETSTFDVTNILNKQDINSIIRELNNGILIPDNKEITGNPTETLEILVLNDRIFNINRQQDNIFVVRYSINPNSNSYDDFKHTTFKSEVLKNYFDKLEQASKQMSPIRY